MELTSEQITADINHLTGFNIAETSDWMHKLIKLTNQMSSVQSMKGFPDLILNNKANATQMLFRELQGLNRATENSNAIDNPK